MTCMIEIKITKKEENLKEVGYYIDKKYNLEAVIKINENANMLELMLAIVQAMKLEGYTPTQNNLKNAVDGLVADGEIEHGGSIY